MGEDRLIGPGLKDITKKRDRDWLVKWITNSQEFIKSGDKEAVKLWEDWKPTVMTPFYFSDEEFEALFAYLENPPVEENIAAVTSVTDNKSETNNMTSLLMLVFLIGAPEAWMRPNLHLSVFVMLPTLIFLVIPLVFLVYYFY